MNFQPKTEKEIADSKLLKTGIYQFEILEAWEKTSAAGNAMIELKVHVSNGHGQSRTLADYLLPQRAEKLRHAAAACGVLDRYESGELSAADFAAKHGRLKVGVEKKQGYSPRNVIDDYIPAQDGD
jgi:hypothetical protein